MSKYDDEKQVINGFINGFLEYSVKRMSSIKRYSTRKLITSQSVLEHEGGVTAIAMLISDYFNQKGIKNDTEKVLRMAIFHDLEEVVSGDLPHDAKYQFGEKSDNLRKALNELTEMNIRNTLSLIGNKKIEEKYYLLFNEERGKVSIEAKIVKMADFVDVMIYTKTEMDLGNKSLIAEYKNSTERFEKILKEIIK